VAVKIIVVVIFLLIIFNLGSALFYMLKDGGQGQGNRMARSLTWRIGLSVGAFLLLMLAFWLGWIEPHGITPTASQ
jgi:hypothetical protein